MAIFQVSAKNILNSEGGFQNSPSDKGNYCNGLLIGTNHGISAITYKEVYGKCPTVEDIKALKEEEAIDIYKRLYWNKVQGDVIHNQSVATMLLDTIVLQGGSKLSNIKDAANLHSFVKIDSNDNPLTYDEAIIINSVNQELFFNSLKEARIVLFKDLVFNDPSKKKFLDGWIGRVNRIEFKENPITQPIDKIINDIAPTRSKKKITTSIIFMLIGIIIFFIHRYFKRK